jgi:hypothetical protein
MDAEASVRLPAQQALDLVAGEIEVDLFLRLELAGPRIPRPHFASRSEFLLAPPYIVFGSLKSSAADPHLYEHWH